MTKKKPRPKFAWNDDDIVINKPTKSEKTLKELKDEIDKKNKKEHSPAS